MQRRRIEHKVESMAEKTRFEIRRVEGCQLIQYIYGYILDISNINNIKSEEEELVAEEKRRWSEVRGVEGRQRRHSGSLRVRGRGQGSNSRLYFSQLYTTKHKIKAIAFSEIILLALQGALRLHIEDSDPNVPTVASEE